MRNLAVAALLAVAAPASNAALPLTPYLVRAIATPLPVTRPGKSGIAAHKRAARKARHKKRHGHH
jgi:hypothetical protein